MNWALNPLVSETGILEADMSSLKLVLLVDGPYCFCSATRQINQRNAYYLVPTLPTDTNSNEIAKFY